MGKVHGKNARVLVDQFDLSKYFDAADVEATAELSDATAFQDGAEKNVVGLLGGKLSLGGFFDGVADAADEELEAALGASAGAVVTAAPEDLALGKRCSLALLREASYKVTTIVRDAVKIGAELQSDDEGIRGGVALEAAKTARSGSFLGASVDNTAATTKGAIGHLHIIEETTALSATTWKIQHSVDDVVWVDLITFTAFVDVAGERKKATGTVNRFTRALGTMTGSAKFAMALARL